MNKYINMCVYIYIYIDIDIDMPTQLGIRPTNGERNETIPGRGRANVRSPLTSDIQARGVLCLYIYIYTHTYTPEL